MKRRSKILRIRAEKKRKKKENKKEAAYNVLINAYRHSTALHAWVDMQAKEEVNRHTQKKCTKEIIEI